MDKKVLLHTIAKNLGIKASIVEKDEKELGLRKILNYGHTIGHAIESLSNYTMSHGNCIAIGMNASARLSHKVAGAKEDLTKRQNNLLIKAGLPISLPIGIRTEDILDKMKLDKKNLGNQPKFVLLKSIGKVVYNIEVPERILFETIDEIR